MKKLSNGKKLAIKYFILFFIFISALAALLQYQSPGCLSSLASKTVIEEASSINKSSSSQWWLSSGGTMTLRGNEFSTNYGKLAEDSKWQKLYAKTNSRDTEGGYYPQNVFRLATRKKWQNFSQQVDFCIDKINLVNSQFRNASNGILFFIHYRNENNLYYAGLRVDGNLVIKKKINEKYYTMAEKEILTNGKRYDTVSSPNVLPLKRWMSLKAETRDIGDNTVEIKLYVKKDLSEDWHLVLEAQDKGDKYGKAPILDKGYGGIRADFMDARFKNYEAREF